MVINPSKIREQLLQALYPNHFACILCNAEIRPNKYGLCDCCKLIHNTKYCKQCGTPISDGIDYCRDCTSKRNARLFDTARSALIYDDTMHTLMLKVKFGQARWILDFLAQYLIDLITDCPPAQDNIVLIPVPIAPTKLKQRGFNQSEHLSHLISKHLNIPSINALVKPCDNQDQARLNKRARIQNVQNVFFTAKGINLRDKNIILIDDLFTTGATANACTTVLKPLKPKSIHIYTLATPMQPQLPQDPN